MAKPDEYGQIKQIAKFIIGGIAMITLIIKIKKDEKNKKSNVG